MYTVYMVYMIHICGYMVDIIAVACVPRPSALLALVFCWF